MVASWRISEEKYPQKNQGTAGLEPATFSLNCRLQARLTSALKFVGLCFYLNHLRSIVHFYNGSESIQPKEK
jgi:hypothetical protein